MAVVRASSEYDVIVIGGGPAGSTAATLIARAGHRVLLLERDRFPRHQVGESLLPATIHEVADLLGIREEIRGKSFPVKRGATFSWGTDDFQWDMHFGGSAATTDDLSNTPFAHNVSRADFDLILLNNARRSDVDVREGHRAIQALKNGDRISGLRFEDEVGKAHEATAQFVVDASGNRSFLASDVGERTYSKFFRNVGIYAYYYGAKRLPPPRDGNVVFEAFEDGWLWFIPMNSDLTSVGAVVTQHGASKLQDDPESMLRGYIRACPTIVKMLADARRVNDDPFSSVRIRKEFSYCNSCFWAPGAVLLGDAACFVDVLLSSGVHIATYSGIQAARSINTVLRATLGEQRCFDAYELRTRLEFTRFYHCLMGLYDTKKDSTTYQNWLRHYLQETNGVRLDLTETDNDTSHDAQQATTGDSPLRFLREVNRVLLQYDGPPKMEAAVQFPRFDDGLVPSEDLLHWVERESRNSP